MSVLPGIAGTLFPTRYLADRLQADVSAWSRGRPGDDRHRRWNNWWRGVESACGPATGIRALFDLVAMPLFGMLGFRARDVQFDGQQCRMRLETPRGSAVACVLLPWAARPSALWRDASAAARAAGAAWCFVLAPPFLSLVDVRRRTVRHSLEFAFPAAFDPRSHRCFWTLAHAAAFDVVASSCLPAPSLIEAVLACAADYRSRVSADLEQGVGRALSALSTAIAPRQTPRGRISTTRTSPTPFDQALTIVYRVLFLLFAESRSLVPREDPLYAGAYAVGELCRDTLQGAVRPGLWEGLAAITRLSRMGCRTADLIVRPFNGRLFARRAAPALEERRGHRRGGRHAARRDEALGDALLALTTRSGPAGRETINYRDLDVEQLGAVYERVLDLPTGPAGTIPSTAGRRHSALRRRSGTFYTPQPLAEYVVRRTLAPLVSGASADGILALRVVDPAMGSGAFLVAACRYLAAAYEHALIAEGRTTAADLDDDDRADIRRLVAERCLAGVDRNPVAVQLAQLSLWLTTLARGKPLSFLDHRLRTGDSLIGASPDDLRRTSMRRFAPDAPLFDDFFLDAAARSAAIALGELRQRRDDTVADVRAKESIWQRLTSDASPLQRWRTAADLWCARWFWPGGRLGAPGSAELRALLDAVLGGDRTLGVSHVARRISTARDIARRHAFFHWPLEFSDVFYDESGQPRSTAGFDAIIGNPPWEMLRLDTPVPTESVDRVAETRDVPVNLVRFVRDSRVFRACGRGHLNLYQPFLDRSLSLVRPGGRVGLILPWGFASDDGAADLRRRVLDETAVDAVVGFENSARLFPIHRGLRFLVLTTSPGGRTEEFRARFGARQASEIEALPGGDETRPEAFPLRLTRDQLTVVGGPALRIPDVRHADDLQLAERLARLFPALGDSNGWGASFGRELNATEDRKHLGDRGMPVVEGKHVNAFLVDTSAPAGRIDHGMARRLLPGVPFDHARLGYRDVSGAGNRQPLIAAVIPANVVTSHTVLCLKTPFAPERQYFLCGLFNSFVLNMLVRLVMGGHVTTAIVERLPVPVWAGDRTDRRIAKLAEQCAVHPATAVRARLEATVAARYELSEREFTRLVGRFRLVPEADRAASVSAFRRQASATGRSRTR